MALDLATHAVAPDAVVGVVVAAGGGVALGRAW